MPQIVELDDGTEVEFPDDLPQNEILRVLNNNFGPKSQEIQSNRAALQTEMRQEQARPAATTLGQLPGVVSDFVAPPPADRPSFEIPSLTTPITPAQTPEERSAREFYSQQALLGGDIPTRPHELRSIGDVWEAATAGLGPSAALPDAQTLADALDVVKSYASQSEEKIAALGEPSRKPTRAENILTGLQRATATLEHSIRSPLGIGTFGLAAAPAGAQTLAKAAFGTHMATQVPGQIEAGIEALQRGDEAAATEHFAGAGMQTTFVGGLGKSVASDIRQFRKNQLPRTSSALEETTRETRETQIQKEKEVLTEPQSKAQAAITAAEAEGQLVPIQRLEAGKEPTPAATVPPPEPTAPVTTTGEIKTPAAAELPVAAEPSTPISTTPVEIPQGPGLRGGPGAAAIEEFAQVAAETQPRVFGKLVDWIKRHRTPDNPNIGEAVQRRDIMAGRQWANSPEFLFRKDPVAAPLVSRIVESQLRHNDRAGRDTIHFEELTKSVPKESLNRITTALRELEAGDKTALTARLTPEEQAIAQNIRQYFDQWKTRLQDRKIENLIEALPDARGKTVREVLAGESLEVAAKRNKLRGPGRTAVKLAINDIEQTRNWGIDDYITHAEQGHWRIVNEEGTTIAIAETKPDAYQKIEAYLRDNPDVGKLTLDDSFNPGVDWPSQLTLPAYGKLLKQLKDSTGETAKALQEALRKTAPGIVLKPTSKYNRFLQRRRDVLKGEENIMDVLPSYIYSMWKKFELDPILKESRATLPKLGPETRDAVEGLLADVKGQKYLGDKVGDYLLSGAADVIEKTTGFVPPIKPFAYSRGVSGLRGLTAWMKLGYRPISILVNRLGGIQHTWTKTGFRDYLEGRKWIKSEEGQRLLKENEAEIGLQAAFATEGRIAREEPWYKPLGLFQKMEHFNRPEAFGAFYIQGTKRMGLSGQEALQYARNSTRFAQFTYNTASLPKIMRGPTGKLLLQFKSYLVKEMEFISTLRGAEIARYLTGFLALGGPRAAIIMLRSLPILGVIGILSKLEDWLNQEAPRATRGVPGFAGVDISAAVTPQLPAAATDWVGPTLTDYFRLWKDVIRPAIQGENKDWNDLAGWGSRTAPTIFYITQMIESIMDKQGWITDARGRKQFQANRWDKAKLALGVTPLDKSIEATDRRILDEMENIQRKNRASWLDNVTDALEKNDEEKLRSLLGDATEYYASEDDFSRAVMNNMLQRELPAKERLFRRLSKATRLREIERFTEPEKEEAE